LIGNRIKGIQRTVLLGQMTAASILFWVWAWLLDTSIPGYELVGIQIYFHYHLALLAGFIFYSLRRNPNRLGVVNLTAMNSVRSSHEQFFCAVGMLLVYLVISKDDLISRMFLVTYLFLLYVQLLSLNKWLPQALCRLLFKESRAQNVLLVGRPVDESRLRTWLEEAAEYGCRVVGRLTDTASDGRLDEYQILGGWGDLKEVCEEEDLDMIIALRLPESEERRQELSALAEEKRLRLLIINDMVESFGHSLTYFQHHGMDFMSLRAEPLEDPFNRAGKRVFDIVFSLMVLVFVLPVVSLLVAVFQAIQSPGPLFYRQDRSGLNNELFTILKFRTMRVGHGADSTQATEQDERVFAFGRFMRRISLDELPQFWNVFKGEMSVVGPRPHMPEHDELFSRALSDYYVRNYIRPGLTGLAQVRGFRGRMNVERDIVQRVRHDISYIENWSFMLDFLIIAKTFRQVLFPPQSAY